MTTTSPSSESPPCAGVLVVEDDQQIRDALRSALGDEGYQVLVAENGAQALGLLREMTELPCVILLDLMMPVMDGWQFRAEQTRDPRLSGIPVVVVTADGRASQKAASLQAADALAKPLRLDSLLAAISRHCG